MSRERIDYMIRNKNNISVEKGLEIGVGIDIINVDTHHNINYLLSKVAELEGSTMNNSDEINELKKRLEAMKNRKVNVDMLIRELEHKETISSVIGEVRDNLLHGLNDKMQELRESKIKIVQVSHLRMEKDNRIEELNNKLLAVQALRIEAKKVVNDIKFNDNLNSSKA